MPSDPRATFTVACSCPVAGHTRDLVCVMGSYGGIVENTAIGAGFPS
jgi:hypothetical protein